MSEYAPQAIFDLFTAIQSKIPQAVDDGIEGDANHTYGYHRSRNWILALGRDGSADYSLQLPLDREGDGDAVAALDIGLPADLMKLCTERLLAAAQNHDPRLAAVREFCGTLDGQNTYPWDLASNQSEGLNAWDSSHLSHIHLSFYRAHATSLAELAPIADVLAGATGDEVSLAGSSETPITFRGDEDMEIITRAAKKDLPVLSLGSRVIVLKDATSARNAGTELKRRGQSAIAFGDDDYWALRNDKETIK